MNLKTIAIIMFFLFVALFSKTTFAQANYGEERFSVGFQSSFPAWGLSAKKNFGEKYAIQAIIGPVGALKTFAGRGLMKIKEDEMWSMYGYGTVGIWHYSFLGVGETVLGYGAGAGIEYDIRSLDEDLPPIYLNAELGIGVVNFGEVDYNFSTITIGIGAHYAIY